VGYRVVTVGVVALAAAISCASLALSDGGIEMFDLAIGLSLVSCLYTFRAVATRAEVNLIWVQGGRQKPVLDDDKLHLLIAKVTSTHSNPIPDHGSLLEWWPFGMNCYIPNVQAK